MRDGKLAGEWYFNGTGPDTTQNVYSATKSVTSTLVGIAQDDGDLRIDQSAARWIPEWRGTPAKAVTVRDLLSNDSGREWSLLTDYVQLLGGARPHARSPIGLRQTAAPGTVWAYNNSAEQTLERVLQRATGRDVVDVRAAAPVRSARHDAHDDDHRQGGQRADVRGRAVDLPRHGPLRAADARPGPLGRPADRVARLGRGGDGPVVDQAQRGVRLPVVAQPQGRPGATRSSRRALRVGRAADAHGGRIVPGAPDSMFWALGLGNQIVQVDPEPRTVVVRLGDANPLALSGSFGPAEASKVVTEAVVG